jgi:hypothetical protein
MLNSTQQPAAAADSVKTTSPEREDGRRLQRIALPLPARVEAKIDTKASWNEITRLNDISAFGAGFSLTRPVKRGRLLHFTIPMPRQLRCFDYSEPQYKIWGVVRRCIETKETAGENFAVGAAFIGKTPPPGYLEHPSMLYEVTHRESDIGFWQIEPADLFADESSLPADLRKHTRFQIPEAINIQLLDDAGNVTAYETTVTENISRSGAAVFTQHKLPAGTFIRVTSERHNVTILSVVRGSRLGSDGISRIHIEFIDSLFPMEGLV